MLIQVDRLKKGPRQVEVDEPATDFAVIHELIRQGEIAFEEPIHGQLTAAWAGKIIEVSGRLSSRMTLSCGRCLAPVASELDVDILLCYERVVSESAAVAEEVEIAAEELGLIKFSGQEIDLGPDLEQEIIMALPQQVLCDQSCKGLCPVCGANMNQQSCSCEKPVFHSGLAALKNFKIKD